MQLREQQDHARRRAARVELDAALRSGRAHPATLERLRRCAFDLDQDMAIQPMGSRTVSSGPTPPAPPAVTNLEYWVIATQNATIANAKSGTGDSFTFATPNVTLTDAAGLFVANDNRQRLNITGATTPANNGYFWTNLVTAPNSTRFPNSAGVAEAFPGNWSIPGSYSQIVDLTVGRVFSNATVLNRPRVITDLVPGTSLPCDLTGSVASKAECSLTCVNAFANNFQTGSVSFAMRVYLAQTPVGVRLAIVRPTGSSNQYVAPFLNTSTQVRLATGSGGPTGDALVTVPALPLLTWFTAGISCVRSGGSATATYYQNGVLVATGAAGGNVTPSIALQEVVLGEITISSNTGEPAWFGWAGGSNVAWSAAEHLAVHNAFLAYGSPT